MLVPTIGAAQGSTGTVTGRVVADSTGNPVIGALVGLDGAAPATETSGRGEYRLSGVAAGTHTITVRRVGYATVSKEVSVTAGATTKLDVILRVNTATLGAVTVIGTRTDLDETRKRAAEV